MIKFAVIDIRITDSVEKQATIGIRPPRIVP